MFSYIANPNYNKIIQTDASEIGYGGILLQEKDKNIEQPQQNYSTIKIKFLQ